MIHPKRAFYTTEFLLTFAGLGTSIWLYMEGLPLMATVLASTCIGSYNLARGIMKAGFGIAAHNRGR